MSDVEFMACFLEKHGNFRNVNKATHHFWGHEGSRGAESLCLVR